MSKEIRLKPETPPMPEAPPNWETFSDDNDSEDIPSWLETHDQGYTQPKVKNMAVRVSDEVFEALEKQAAVLDISTTDALRRVLYAYLLPDIAIAQLEEYRPVLDKTVPYDVDAAIAYVNQLATYLDQAKRLQKQLKGSLTLVERKTQSILDAIGQVNIWSDAKVRYDRVEKRKEGQIIP